MADVPLMNNPMTTAEDIIVGGVSGAPARKAKGSNGDVLTVTAGAVGWAAPASSSSAFHGVIAAKSSSFPSLVNNTVTVLAFDLADLRDTDGYHDPASNNTKLIVPSGLAGTYIVFCAVGFAANATGRRYVEVRVGGVAQWIDSRQATGNGSTTSLVTFPPLDLAEAAEVELAALQQSGGALSINQQVFGMYLVGT